MEARSARRVPGARSPSPGSPAALHELSSIVGNSAFAALVGAGRAADPEVRSAVEQRLGVDLGDVHVHTGPAAAAAAPRRCHRP